MLDLILENAQIVDIIRQRIFKGWLGIKQEKFIFVEEGKRVNIEAKTIIDLDNAIIQPGLIDSHMHIESSLLTPGRFAEASLPWGTTSILQDPHEVANVLGAAGIRFMVDASRDLPLNIYSAISSCIPATSDDLETANAKISPAEIIELACDPNVIALGEMMDYQGVVAGQKHLEDILEAGKEAGLSLEGHVPSLSGVDLSTYISYGIRSDHTLMTPEKIAEELSKGLYVMLQEKSITEENIDFINTLPDRSRILIISDDIMPNRLVFGQLNKILELAIKLGWQPLDALASATIRPAAYLGLNNAGMIAPGYRADFCICEDLNMFPPQEVYSQGKRVAEAGQALFKAADTKLPEDLTSIAPILKTADLLSQEQFWLRLEPNPRVNIISVNDINTFTELEQRKIKIKDGHANDNDLVMATVIARASLQSDWSEDFKISLFTGLKLKKGAFATSFSHDSHNILVLGKTAKAMTKAANAVIQNGGGMAVYDDELSFLPLPIAGLLSDAPIAELAEQFDRLEQKLRQLGMTHKNPILLLTILPLTVSPNYKISDKGIVDVENRRLLDLNT